MLNGLNIFFYKIIQLNLNSKYIIHISIIILFLFFLINIFKLTYIHKKNSTQSYKEKTQINNRLDI
jgi:ATP/ADP translocase